MPGCSHFAETVNPKQSYVITGGMGKGQRKFFHFDGNGAIRVFLGSEKPGVSRFLSGLRLLLQPSL